MAFTIARTSPTGTTKIYRNLDHASVVAIQVPQAETTNKWFARATGPNGEDYYVLDAVGYASRGACEAAIETALGIGG